MNDKATGHSRRTFLAASAALVAASGSGLTDANAQSAEAGKITVSTIADALNKVGRDPMSYAMSSDIKPLTSGSHTVIGPAVITKWQAGQGRMTADDVRKFMFEPLDQAQAGSIWVVAGGTNQKLSLFGGVIGVACKRNGMLGAVTDNACRDIDTFEEADFPVFGKASVPYGPGELARPVAANVPVICGGVDVSPGDYIAADKDGVIVIPGGEYANVMVATSEILAKEREILQKIASGVSLAEAYTL